MSKTKVVEQKPDHHDRIELLNIMLGLGLPVYALALYTYYKKVAGDSGHCNTSNATIQRVMGFSPNTTKKYRDVLARPHPLLGGKPLICVTENRVTDEGDQETVLVEIVNIWRENGDNEAEKHRLRQLEKEKTGRSKNKLGTSRGERGGVPHAVRYPPSRDETKEEPIKNIKEDNVFPTRARENPKPKKDIVLSPEAMEKPKAKALDPERFRRKLDIEQRELHDKLVAFNPEWGESLSSDFVCLLFNDKKPYTVKQIENAFAVYEQDATAARARNRSIRSLSAYLRDALKKGRRPECADFEFNKSHAEFVQKRRPGIKIMKKYAKVMIGKSQHEVDFDLPKAEFIRQLEKLLQLFQDML